MISSYFNVPHLILWPSFVCSFPWHSLHNVTPLDTSHKGLYISHANNLSTIGNSRIAALTKDLNLFMWCAVIFFLHFFPHIWHIPLSFEYTDALHDLYNFDWRSDSRNSEYPIFFLGGMQVSQCVLIWLFFHLDISLLHTLHFINFLIGVGTVGLLYILDLNRLYSLDFLYSASHFIEHLLAMSARYGCTRKTMPHVEHFFSTIIVSLYARRRSTTLPT